MFPEKIIDTHFHLWDIKHLNYPWLTDLAINKTYTINDYQKATETIPIIKMVFVQCECLPEQYKNEIAYVTETAIMDNRIQGIISWFPMEKREIKDELSHLKKNPLIRGIRRLEESQMSLYNQAEFVKNVQLLSKFNLSFDICVKANQLPSVAALVDQCPETLFMLDHLGKPDIRNKELKAWKQHIKTIARHPNVFCKISGMVTEARLQSWKTDDIRPYFEFAVEHFGMNRLAFGGDWPVVNLAGTYFKWYHTLLDLCKDFSENDLDNLFYNNAAWFYRL